MHFKVFGKPASGPADHYLFMPSGLPVEFNAELKTVFIAD